MRPSPSSSRPERAVQVRAQSVALEARHERQALGDVRAALVLQAHRRLDVSERGEAVGQQRLLAGVLRQLDRLGGLRAGRRPAPEPEVEVRAGGERVDQRADRAGVAGRGDQAVEDPLRAVELLDPDRRVRGHAHDLDDRQRVALEQVRLADGEQRVALLDVAEREVGLADHRGGEQLHGRVGGGGQRPRALGGGDQRVHVAGHHVRDRRLEEHRGGPPRVARAHALGLGHEQLVGHQRRAAPHLHVPGHALHVGGEQRVGRQPRRVAEQGERAVGLARARGVGGRLEQPPRPRLVVRGELGGAPEVARRGGVRAAPAGVERRRLERRRHALVGRHRAGGEVPGALRAALGRRGRQRGVRGPPVGAAGGVVGGRAQQRVAEVDLAVGDRDQPRRLRPPAGAPARDRPRAARARSRRAGRCAPWRRRAARAGRRRRARRARGGRPARRRCPAAAAPRAARAPPAGRRTAGAGSRAAPAGCPRPCSPAGRRPTAPAARCAWPTAARAPPRRPAARSAAAPAREPRARRRSCRRAATRASRCPPPPAAARRTATPRATARRATGRRRPRRAPAAPRRRRRAG